MATVMSKNPYKMLLLLLLQVDIGTMQVDYSALVWQQKVRMNNVPTGRVRIHLSGNDMGNFVSHPLFQAAAATAVHVSSVAYYRYVSELCVKTISPRAA
jgi:hypothetical protein